MRGMRLGLKLAVPGHGWRYSRRDGGAGGVRRQGRVADRGGF